MLLPSTDLEDGVHRDRVDEAVPHGGGFLRDAAAGVLSQAFAIVAGQTYKLGLYVHANAMVSGYVDDVLTIGPVATGGAITRRRC